MEKEPGMSHNPLYSRITAAVMGQTPLRELVKWVTANKSSGGGGKREIKTIGMFFWRIRGDGTGRVISMLSHLWSGMGYDVVLFTEEEPTDSDYAMPQGVKRIVLPPLKADCNATQIMERVDTVMRSVEEYGIDLFIDNAFHSEHLIWNLLAAKCGGAFTAVYMHQFAPSLFCKLDGMMEQRFSWYSISDLVIALSLTDKRLFENMGVSAEYIPNQCDFNLIKRSLQCCGNRLLWVGRLAWEKKPIQVIEAFRLIKRQLPSAELTMVGTGYLRDEVEAYVKNSGIDGITMTGFVKDIAGYYSRSDLLLFASEYEGFPLAINEAHACGLPVVMYDLPFLEQVRDGRGIAVVEQDDIKALADRAVELLKSPDEWKRLSCAASTRYEEYSAYDWKTAWRNVFDQLSNDKGVETTLQNEYDRNIIRLMLRYHSIGMDRAYSEIKELRSCSSIKNSRTYKVGKAVMWIPSWIRKLFRP